MLLDIDDKLVKEFVDMYTLKANINSIEGKIQTRKDELMSLDSQLLNLRTKLSSYCISKLVRNIQEGVIDSIIDVKVEQNKTRHNI